MRGRKRVFFSHYWVEQRHDYLMSLPLNDAKKLVESFDEYEIEENVNYRRFQEQYICDYIDYLWRISKKSFWKHIAISLKHPEGLIPSESDFTTEIMKTERMPKYVLRELLKAFARLFKNTKKAETDFLCQIHAEIICNKLCEQNELERLKVIILEWFTNLDKTDQKTTYQLFKQYIREDYLHLLGFQI